jgi:hypothetical protein
VIVADVQWIRDRRGRPTLELTLDGHPAHIRSSQRTELTGRGIVDGMVFLASERIAQQPNIYIQGDFTPEFHGLDLVGCTDDPGVFALYEEMCRAILTDTWHEGSRSASATDLSVSH